MKIYLRLLFVLSMSLLYGRQQSMAVEVVVDNVNYEINSDNTATCTGSRGTIENLIIPDYITYMDRQYPVTVIKDYAFYTNKNLKGSLTIGNNVTTIGEMAFNYCVGLTGSLIIPDSVKEIGRAAFDGCQGFTGSLIIGNSVTTIGSNAFHECSGFTGSLIIGNSVTTIGYKAFYGCSGFTGSLIIGNSVTTIGYYAFYECSGFTGSLKLGESLRELEQLTFYGCSGFTGSLIIPASIKTIYSNAFGGCTGFDELIAMGTTVPKALSEAFQGWNYSSVPLIVPAETLQSYKSATPWNYFATIKASYTLDNIVYTLNADNTAIITGVSDTSSNFENFTIPKSVSVNKASYTVTTIGEGAFEGCRDLKGTLTIPSTVNYIGANAFGGCNGITRVNSEATTAPVCDGEIFPESVYQNALLMVSNETSYINTQGWNQFVNINGYNVVIDSIAYRLPYGANQVICVGLDSSSEILNGIKLQSSVNINNSTYPVTSIALQAFENCTGLKGTLTIPASIRSIGAKAFAGCTGITQVNSEAATAPVCDGEIFSESVYKNALLKVSDESAYSNAQGWSQFVNINGYNVVIDSIAYRLPYGANQVICVGLDSSSEILNGIKLQSSVNINNSTYPVTSIALQAFENCTGLKGTLTIPASIESIGNKAFAGCTGIDELIAMGTTVPNASSDAFQGWNYSSVPLIVPADALQSYKSATPWNSFANIKASYTLDNIVYTLNADNTATIIGVSDTAANFENLTIPGTVSVNNSSYTVTTIGEGAFENCTGLRGTLTIPATVTSIGTNAFGGCTNITHVYCLASKPPVCDDVVFHEDVHQNALLIVDDNLAYSKDKVWSNFKNINGYTYQIEDGNYLLDPSTGDVTYMGPNDPSGLKGVLYIPSQVEIDGATHTITGIGDEALKDATLLTSVVIPPTITSVGTDAFTGCTGLIKNGYPSSISNPFKNGVNVAYPKDGVFDGKTIYSGTQSSLIFVSIDEEGDFQIPSTVNTIAANAFSYCSELTNLSIPSSVSTINSNSFTATAVKSISIDTPVIGNWFSGYTSLESLTLGNDVTTISDDAFAGCSGLVTLIIPQNVTSIGNGAFSGCPITNLTYNAINCVNCGSPQSPAFEDQIKILTIGDNVTSIPDYFLYKGNKIQNLSIPNRVTQIGTSAFNNSNMLKSLTLGAGLLSVSKSMFGGNQIPKVYWLGNTPPEGYNQLRGLVNYTSNDRYNFMDGAKEVSPIIYPFLSSKFEVDGVVYVPVSPSDRTSDVIDCNYYATGEEVVIPASVLYQNVELSVYNISDYAFYDNTNFSSLVLSEIVDKIGNSAFENCNRITSLTFPAAVSSIGDYAFAKCSSVTEIYFNDERFDTDVITLGSNGQNGLFSDCPLVKLYNGRKLEYQPGSSYGYSPFAQIRTLQDVEISDYEIKVGDYEFYGCSALTSLIIGNSVKTIGDWAFSGCYSLKYYSAGLAVETIGEEAFSDCTSVTEFYSYSAVPPVCGNQSLDDINKWNCTLYVPASSLSKYQQEPQWKDFFHIEGMEEPQVAEIRLDKSDESILIGEALQLNATILPAEASNAVLTWTSSDNSVATVSINGLVIGLSAGTATITASYGNVSAECVVTVTKEAGIGNLYNDDPVTINVYNLQGVKFTIRDMNELNQLNPGIYIVNGKKVMIR